MSCGIGCRQGLDLLLLWLWHRPAATAPIWPSLETSICYWCGPERTKKTKTQKLKNKKTRELSDVLACVCSKCLDAECRGKLTMKLMNYHTTPMAINENHSVLLNFVFSLCGTAVAASSFKIRPRTWVGRYVWFEFDGMCEDEEAGWIFIIDTMWRKIIEAPRAPSSGLR